MTPQTVTAAPGEVSLEDEHYQTLLRARAELAQEGQWMASIQSAYGLTDHQVDQIGRAYNRREFWKGRIAEFEELLGRELPAVAEVAA